MKRVGAGLVVVLLAVAGMATESWTSGTAVPGPLGGSEQDLLVWKQQIEGQLAREPLWGPYFERMWRHHLAELASLEASLE